MTNDFGAFVSASPAWAPFRCVLVFLLRLPMVCGGKAVVVEETVLKSKSLRESTPHVI